MRYLPLTPDDRSAMLAAIGVKSIDELFVDVPKAAQRDGFVDLPRVAGEMEVERTLSALAAKNVAAGSVPFFCGAGAYRHHVPATVDHVIQRSEFLTSYTPYQPEIAQGTLQYLYEFQTQVANLTGMEVANASLYDGSTAVAEAAMLAVRATGRRRVVVSHDVHPHHRAILHTYAQGPELEIVEVADTAALILAADGAAGLVTANPSFFGTLVDLRAVAAAAHRAGALAIASVDPVSCAVLAPPGACGIDVAVGDGQPLGIPMSFGGPYVGHMAVRADLVRQLPGRIVGQTTDSNGVRGFVNTLQTREQHIRREKATSNICTNEAVYAIHAAIYLALVGPEGLRAVADRSVELAHRLAARLGAIAGCSVTNPGPFFAEFTLRLPVDATGLRDALLADGIVAGYPLGHDFPDRADELLICCTEMNSDADLDALVSGIERTVRGAGAREGADLVAH